MYNGDVGGVSGGNNTQWNRKLAEQLDSADGKKDGKISASVWNGFINHTGSNGNKIKWNISVDNAAKSFRYYDTKKDTGKVDWNNWENMYKSFTGNEESAKPQDVTAKPTLPIPAADEEFYTTTITDQTNETQKQAIQHKQTDLEQAMKDVKFTESVPTADDLKSGGFGLKADAAQTLPGGQKITIGKQDENGLTYIMDMNGGRTYQNEKGETVRISDFDAQFIVSGGTAVQYSDGKGKSSEVIYDKDGNPVQGSISLIQDDGSSIQYKYKYEAGKPVLQSSETTKVVQQIIQDAGFKPAAEADEQRLEHVAQMTMSDSVDSFLQSTGHGNMLENIMSTVENETPLKRNFHITNQTTTINDDGSKTITYMYNIDGKTVTDTRTIKENQDGSFTVIDGIESISGNVGKEQYMYKQNSDGTITKTDFREDGKPGFTRTVDSQGHVISESTFKLGVNTGKEIEIRRNYFADGSIEKIAFVDGERFDDFYDGDMAKPGELQFKFVKDSPMKIVDSKMPTEADLLKAGFKKDPDTMTMNGGVLYYNEQTGESFVLDEYSKTCEYRKGNITQKHSYDADGNLAYGTIEVKGENGAFETYTYQQNEDYKELTVTSENSHDAPTTPEAFAADALGGHWRNIDEFREELKLPKDLTSDITEGTGEKISDDGNYKMKVTLGSDGNLMVVYSQKQDDGSFKEVGSYKLTKYDASGTLRGYDFIFEAFNNLTGSHRTVSAGDWRGDY